MHNLDMSMNMDTITTCLYVALVYVYTGLHRKMDTITTCLYVFLVYVCTGLHPPTGSARAYFLQEGFELPVFPFEDGVCIGFRERREFRGNCRQTDRQAGRHMCIQGASTWRERCR